MLESIVFTLPYLFRWFVICYFSIKILAVLVHNLLLVFVFQYKIYLFEGYTKNFVNNYFP
jgi:hypothetical protein